MDQPRRAAQYLRMSTEHQRYSLQHQATSIGAYAAMRGCEIVRSYSDAGISGLEYRNRPALRALMADVLSGAADFDVILTYDISRWGRFQDPDQSAHYEFLCREAGIDVIYCAEPFDNDGSFSNVIVKQLKRAMAAEYSRELSVKVSIAQWNLARQGFWMGGPAGYGLRRRIVHADGSLGPILEFGQQKALQSDKVILVAGPLREQQMVKRIFDLFVIGGMSRVEVSRSLNREGWRAEDGGPWSAARVHQVLTNRKYLGEPLFGRTTGKIPQRAKRPIEACQTTPVRFRPLVSRQRFEDAQRAISLRRRKMSEAEMLEGLARLLAERGTLTASIIDDAEDLPCTAIYRQTFGSLLVAYARVGFEPAARAAKAGTMVRKAQPCNRRRVPVQLPPEEMLARLAALLARKGYLSIDVIRDDPEAPSPHLIARHFGSLREAYARVGYVPTEKQLRVMAWWDLRGGTGIPALGQPGAPLVGKALDPVAPRQRRRSRKAAFIAPVSAPPFA